MFQIPLDTTDVQECAADVCNISDSSDVNSTCLQFADIEYGVESNVCTPDGVTSHFPEVRQRAFVANEPPCHCYSTP